MHYEIDEMIGFNPVGGSLWALASPEATIKLPRFAAHLLEVLITENKKSLTRDFLLNTLWDQNGLPASNNNLNNYMSIVRRALASLGLDNIIITIPKYGFSFNATSVTEVSGNAMPLNSETSTTLLVERDKLTDAVPEKITHEQPVPRAPCVSLKVKWFSLLCSLIIAFLLGGYAYLSTPGQPVDSDFAKFKVSYKRCDIDAIWNGYYNFYATDMILADVTKLVNSKKISCDQDAQVYYYRSIPVQAKKFSSQRVLITHCLRDGLSVCNNFYKDEAQHD